MEVAVSDVWAMTLWHSPQPWVQWTAAAVGCAVAAGTDIKERRIPNWLTGPLFLAGLAFLCGSNGFVEAASQLLLEAGLPPQQIRTERFGPTG